jgi:hypothetical protein
MKLKLHMVKADLLSPDAPKLTVTAETIAWIRELATSVSLTPPDPNAEQAEFVQYTWNTAICMAIVEISDRLLNGECPRRGEVSEHSAFPGSKPESPLS